MDPTKGRTERENLQGMYLKVWKTHKCAIASLKAQKRQGTAQSSRTKVSRKKTSYPLFFNQSVNFFGAHVLMTSFGSSQARRAVAMP